MAGPEANPGANPASQERVRSLPTAAGEYETTGTINDAAYFESQIEELVRNTGSF